VDFEEIDAFVELTEIIIKKNGINF